MARPSVDEIAGWGWPGLNATEALSYYMKTETYPTSADFRGQSGNQSAPHLSFIAQITGIQMLDHL